MPTRRKNATLPALVPALLLAGCGSLWTPEDYPEGWLLDASVKPYFYDHDGDGWGNPGYEPQYRVAPEGDYSARNALDCDDTDGNIGPRLGTLCPDQLAAHPDGPSEEPYDDPGYVGVVTGSTEYVVVTAPRDTSYALHAEAACAAWGAIPPQDAPELGARLATFGSSAEFEPLREVLSSDTGEYVGFVGIAPVLDDEGAPVPNACDLDGMTGECDCSDDGSVCWTWTDASDGEFEVDIPTWCDGSPPADTDLDRMALVRRANGGLCIGAPDTVASYDWSEAHFICERPRPDPADHEFWDHTDDAGDSDAE